MPIRQKGVFGNTITTYQWFDNALNPELLQQIAQETNGRFFRVTDESTLTSVFKEIDQLEKSDIKTNEKIKYEELYEKPLKLGLVATIIEEVLARGWWRIIP
jgi:Ca-activated chloride channel family protein